MLRMTFRGDLVDLIGKSHAHAWTTFDWVKHKATTFGMVRANSAERWRTPGEPAFVSNLLEYPFAHYRLRDIIAEHLGPLGLCHSQPVVSGVFVHQKPKVAFRPYRSRVELGDLLLVRQHFQSRVAEPQGRAFLVQAKSSDVPRTGHLAGKEAQQFSLYADWSTPFRFPNKELGSPPDGSKYWDFSKSPMPSPASSGCYGIVANARPHEVHAAFPDACPWAIGTAKNGLAGAKPAVDASSLSLAAALEGFLLGKWGRTWAATPAPTDHWSSFIEQCLRAAANWRGYPVKRLDAAAIPRRRDVLAFVEAFAARPPTYARTGPVDDTVRDVQLRLQHDYQQSEAASHAIANWRDSLPGDGRRNNDPPEPAADAQATPRGGVSVLYVATFGDGPLREAGASPPENLGARHPDWGTF